MVIYLTLVFNKRSRDIMQKKESSDVGEVTRLNVWVKSRTKKDGTAVNMDAAEKIVICCFITLFDYEIHSRVKVHNSLIITSTCFRKRPMSLFGLMIQENHPQTQEKTLLVIS